MVGALTREALTRSYQGALEQNPCDLRVSFELHTDCNQRCPYCVELNRSEKHALFSTDYDLILSRFEEACEIVFSKALKTSFGRATILGGELSYCPYEFQEKLIAVARRYTDKWEVFSNGYDFNSPILSQNDWWCQITDHTKFNASTIEALYKNHDHCYSNFWVKRVLQSKEQFLDCCEYFESHMDSNLTLTIDSNLFIDYQHGKKEAFLSLLSDIGMDEKLMIAHSPALYSHLCLLTVMVPAQTYGHCCDLTKEWPLSEFSLYSTGDKYPCHGMCGILTDKVSLYIKELIKLRRERCPERSIREILENG